MQENPLSVRTVQMQIADVVEDEYGLVGREQGREG